MKMLELQIQDMAQTSGAIQRYVPVSAVIISVTVSSLARPKSASFTDFWLAVSNKLSASSFHIFEEDGEKYIELQTLWGKMI